ncbi:MAG: hypothetical protein EOO65_00830 [Methanosarcinales archaeon]|nr:MAG: hypothetical protein EOO65_00830 [Methanosarcinales archaeon]
MPMLHPLKMTYDAMSDTWKLAGSYNEAAFFSYALPHESLAATASASTALSPRSCAAALTAGERATSVVQLSDSAGAVQQYPSLPPGGAQGAPGTNEQQGSAVGILETPSILQEGAASAGSQQQLTQEGVHSPDFLATAVRPRPSIALGLASGAEHARSMLALAGAPPPRRVSDGVEGGAPKPPPKRATHDNHA